MHSQYEAYMRICNEKQVGRTIIYASVSNAGQKDGLENQVGFLKQFADAKGIIIDEVMTDIESGLNYNRKKWNSIVVTRWSTGIEKSKALKCLSFIMKNYLHRKK